jgi:hypothetical protein
MKKLNITKHAIKQYKRRINDAPDIAVKKIICSLVRESYYVSDNKNGVLLKHNTGIVFIVRRKKVITVWSEK